MPTKKLLAGLPKKDEVVFVYYYHETEVGSDVVVRVKSPPFKASIVAVNFEDDGKMYTVRHIPRMKRIAKADALAHKTWIHVMEDS